MATTTIAERLRRVFVPFDRRALRERLAALEGPHAEAARIRAEEIAVAKAELEAWREPLLRAQRLEAAHRAAARAEARERDEIEAQLRKNPQASVLALERVVESGYARINRRTDDSIPYERFKPIGDALTEARNWIRDEGLPGRLTDSEASRRCQEHRKKIEDAFEGKPEPEGE